jgi:hemoglobin
MGKLEDLHEIIGGNGTIEVAVRAFYYRVLQDENLRHFFQSTDMAALRSGQGMFISMLLGGAVVYTGKNLKDAHATARAQGLTEEHFDAFLNHFRAALDEAGVKSDQAEKVIMRLEAQRAAVLNG